MSFDRLRTFLAVYRERSMGRAAASLGMTQPGVSQQIGTLERELGAPLFDRSRKGVTPTAVADGLARDVAASIDQLSNAMDARLARTQTVGGLLHLGAPAEMFSHYGPRLLASVLDSDIRVRVHLGGRAFLYKGLENGTLDLALTASRPRDRSFGHEVIGEEALALFGHPELARALRGLADPWPVLQQAPFVAYDDDASLLKAWLESAPAKTTPPKPRFLVGDLRSVAGIAAATRGWAVLPTYVVAGDDSAGLVALHPHESANAFHLVWKRGSLRTPRVAFAKERLIGTGL